MSDSQILRTIIQKRVEIRIIKVSSNASEYNYYLENQKSKEFEIKELTESEFKVIKEYVEKWWLENI